MITRLLAASAATAILLPASANATPLVSGQLIDDAGRPVSGPVTVHAWPKERGSAMPVVATATSNDQGEFTAQVDDPAALRSVAVKDDGWVDFIAIAGTGTTTGKWVFTSRIEQAGATLRSVRVEDAINRAGARAAGAAKPPRIRVTVPRRRALGSPIAGPASITGECTDRDPERRRPKSVARWAVIGELNNAYRDTRARFTYGQERHAETSFGVAVSSDNEATFMINGETHVSQGGSITFPTIQRRYARKLRTKFEFTREQIRVTPCSAWETYIRATNWLGGSDDAVKQSRTLNVCDSSYLGGELPGAVAEAYTGDAVRWTRGVAAFGVYLTAKSGFSSNVGLEYRFGQSRKRYYLCGPGGKQGYVNAPRVFSGAR